LFERAREQAMQTLKQITKEPLQITVNFDAIHAAPAAVYIQGTDDGSYSRLRETFMENVSIPDESRRPPKIIHSTIARFRNELDYNAVLEYVDNLKISFTETTTELLLIKEKKIYIQDYDILERFA
jgi:hypothetical protein